jgi:long-chain acyl-CoA synthetase
MTETCIVAANRPDDNRVGSVGLPFAGIDVALSPDGEILIRGANVMEGYYGMPEATAGAFKDGWFATGDVGHMDEAGHLYITDRKKDLFKLSNGKYVAPQMLESLIKQSSLVSQVVVVGAGRKQPAALIVPDWDALTGKFASKLAPSSHTRAEWSRDPQVIRLVRREVSALTADLADYERIRRVALLSEQFSIDSGELTPTLKVKRGVVDSRYADLIDALYADAPG